MKRFVYPLLKKSLSTLLKMFLYTLASIILALVIFIAPWRTDGICGQGAKVNFRGIQFKFPLRARGVLKTPMNGFSRYYTWIKTDSIGGNNISGKWFFDWDTEWNEKEAITETLKEKLIYGVAFELHEDSCKSEQDVVAEVQKIYPGSYRYAEKHGIGYFIWERDCLTIFVKRTYLYPQGYSVPEVSFCYGLSDSQTEIYGPYTGYISSYPD